MDVSIIIPIYNGSKYIQKAIESALNQTFHDFELIVINDGSTDNSETIIKEYEAKYNFIKYIFQKNHS